MHAGQVRDHWQTASVLAHLARPQEIIPFRVSTSHRPCVAGLAAHCSDKDPHHMCVALVIVCSII